MKGSITNFTFFLAAILLLFYGCATQKTTGYPKYYGGYVFDFASKAAILLV